MIGHDFRFAGLKKYITTRFGDGKGYPYEGPIKICDVRWNVFAIWNGKDKSIAIQNLRGVVEAVIYPKKLEAEIEKSFAEQAAEIERNKDLVFAGSADDDAAAKIAGTGLIIGPDNAHRAYLDITPTDLCRVPNRNNTIAITDRKYAVKLIDLNKMCVVDSFGKYGNAFGQLSVPSAIDTFMHERKVFYCVGDNGEHQKLHIFNDDFEPVVWVGELGPAPCQFRDIVSVAASNTSTYPAQLKDQDKHEYPYNPVWYKGFCDLEELENHLYDENFNGNFVMGRRMNPKNTYDILHVSRAKKLVHIIVKEEEPSQEPIGPETGKSKGTAGVPQQQQRGVGRGSGGSGGVYIVNQTVEKRLYPCIHALVKDQRHFNVGGDCRPYAMVAVADKGNFRVQVFRFYWTVSPIYRPEIKLSYILGGPKKQHVELLDPCSVSFTPTGELCVSDVGAGNVLLLSRYMELIKRIDIRFVSIRDLEVASAEASNNYTALGSKPSGSNTHHLYKRASKVSVTDGGGGTGGAGVVSHQYGDMGSGSDWLYQVHDFHHAADEPVEDADEAAAARGRGKPPRVMATISSGASGSAKQWKEQGRQGPGLQLVSGSLSHSHSGAVADKEDSGGRGQGQGLIPSAAREDSIGMMSLRSSLSRSTSGIQIAPPERVRRGGGIGSLSRSTSVLKLQRAGSIDTACGASMARSVRTVGTAATSLTRPSTSGIDPEIDDLDSAIMKKRMKVLAEQEQNTANRWDLFNGKPCTVLFTSEGNMVIGYKSGGFYVFGGYNTFSMGNLNQMQTSVLEKIIIHYLTYSDIESLRNCCTYLHNFTRDLRYEWKIFPPPRNNSIFRVLSLFIEWGRVDDEGREAPVFELHDFHGHAICPRHLRAECGDKYCKRSHAPIYYARDDLSGIGAFIRFDDFWHFASVLFGPKFLWKYEPYIKILFDSYSVEKLIAEREDPMTRKNEVIREKNYVMSRVLYFPAYLEIMVLLEEQYCKLKPIHAHKLFSRKPRADVAAEMQQGIDIYSIDRRIVRDEAERYDFKGIDVPFKAQKGRRFVTRPGMESAERHRAKPVEEHIDMVQRHTDKACDLISRLFS